MKIDEQQHRGHPLGRDRRGRGSSALPFCLPLQRFACERQKSDHVENDADVVNDGGTHQFTLLEQQGEQVNPEKQKGSQF